MFLGIIVSLIMVFWLNQRVLSSFVLCLGFRLAIVWYGVNLWAWIRRMS